MTESSRLFSLHSSQCGVGVGVGGVGGMGCMGVMAKHPPATTARGWQVAKEGRAHAGCAATQAACQEHRCPKFKRHGTAKSNGQMERLLPFVGGSSFLFRVQYSTIYSECSVHYTPSACIKKQALYSCVSKMSVVTVEVLGFGWIPTAR